MKHFFSLLLFVFTASSIFGASDTIVLINDVVPDFEFNLSYIDKFGDNIQIQRIKERKIETEMPYVELKTLSSVYWLRKGNYHVYSMGENRIPTFQTFDPKDKMQDNEVMFFLLLYANNPELKSKRMQEQNEIEKGIFHIKSKERYNQKLTYLENQKPNISSLFYDLCGKIFMVKYLNDLLYLYAKEKREDIKQILLNHKSAIQFENLLFSQEYKDFCSSYSFFLNSESNHTAYLRTTNTFNGKIRDYFLFDLIKKSKNKEVINTFLKDCQDEEYCNYMRKELDVKEKFLSSKDLLMQVDLIQLSLEDVLSRYKGKIVYVDIWASWCGPCRKLLPKSHQLKEHFKEDVAFIYLSIDENVGQWKSAVQNERLDEKDSYLISEKSNFIKEHEIMGKKGIPYYFIFDRTGKLIKDDAMRPNNKNFVEKMNEIIAL
jgi:thiol-disulfide isomerase/thioredoxin